MIQAAKKFLPKSIKRELSTLRSRLKTSNIVQSTGSLNPFESDITFVLCVGSTFDQQVPNAMMTARMGYCHGFEDIGVPYLIVDIRELQNIIQDVPNPICMLLATDVHLVKSGLIKELQNVRSIVWGLPWFRGSDKFFVDHDLDPEFWYIPESSKRKILDIGPDFLFSATSPSGFNFFEEWTKREITIKSLPLACDTHYYGPNNPHYAEFEDIDIAFVGGYWWSKGRQLDAYLRQFEERLIVYGYNAWPYSGYRGRLSREREASLYCQAKISPAVNEPSVALLKGQINERVFKVAGSKGCAVVDAVPEYRELYGVDELLVADNPQDFREIIETLLKDENLRNKYAESGHSATMARHTYAHRAREVLNYLDLELPAISESTEGYRHD